MFVIFCPIHINLLTDQLKSTPPIDYSYGFPYHKKLFVPFFVVRFTTVVSFLWHFKTTTTSFMSFQNVAIIPHWFAVEICCSFFMFRFFKFWRVFAGKYGNTNRCRRYVIISTGIKYYQSTSLSFITFANFLTVLSSIIISLSIFSFFPELASISHIPCLRVAVSSNFTPLLMAWGFGTVFLELSFKFRHGFVNTLKSGFSSSFARSMFLAIHYFFNAIQFTSVVGFFWIVRLGF